MVLTRNDATMKAVFMMKKDYRIAFTVHNSTRNVQGFNSKKFVAVAARCRHGREFKHVSPFNVYLAEQYLVQIQGVS